jgi:hypothetical protein
VTLIEILAQPWNQYRQGIIFCFQRGDLDASVLMIEAMAKVLPPPNRPTLPELPVVANLTDDLLNRKMKYDWCREAVKSVEDAISRWVHDNFDRIGMA